ncbi:hypothetical protein CEE37_05000 [candidate division LCP-89 bacterium B3_LCP]|uniref:TonB-dependent receptor-like beta-barrel domain-containing protein n=1 Tax=candidate division LCP-89 bacterium B3_LCP TaxID=2012998 RepID=A0A532V1E5_UNCL8|nr:MAG: hypothetical protein CEE37_05000 [candidate division LCP-89 bacterium B3_LCP]
MKYTGAILILLIPAILLANSISGIIYDSDSKEPLLGANITLVGTRLGAATDLNGIFKIKDVPPGSYDLEVSMIGYETHVFNIDISQIRESKLNIELVKTFITIPDVVISAERLIEGASVSDVSFSHRQIQSKHGLMEDPVRVMATMPGVITQGDLFSPSQMYVRGGDPAENLFLLDWIQVHWPWYMGGIKSIFNSQIVDKIELLTGGFPPKYGQALSSVLSVTTRDGRQDRVGGSFSFGIMNTQGLLEGPINDRSSFLVTARRTYLDLVVGEDAEFPVPEWYDLNFKLRYELSPKHDVDINGFISYEGTSFFSEDADPGVPEKVITSDELNTQSVVFSSIFKDNLYNKLSLTRTWGDYDVVVGTGFDMKIKAESYGLREDLTWRPHNRHELKTGFDVNYTDYHLNSTMPLDPSDLYTKWDSTGVPMAYYDIATTFYRGGAYVQDSYNMFDPLTLTGGFRMDYHFWTEDFDAMPRLSMRYDLNEKTALRAAWGEYQMYNDPMYLFLNSELKSDQSTHFIIGISQDFNSTYTGWIEAYYKDYDRLTVVDSTGFPTSDGTGHSKGIELFLQKRMGALNGWISYSLSEAKRREYLDDKEYVFDYNQTHMATLVLEYQFPKPNGLLPALIGINFRYSTGRPHTPIVSAYQDSIGNWIGVPGETNSLRYDDYHAMNLRIEWRFPVFGAKGKSYIELWNLYNHKNPNGIEYVFEAGYPDNVKSELYYFTPFMFGGGFAVEF